MCRVIKALTALRGSRSEIMVTIIPNLAQAINQLAVENGLNYLDLEKLFYSASNDNFSVNGLFWDELHPSVEGHRRIADALFPHFKTACEAEQRPN